MPKPNLKTYWQRYDLVFKNNSKKSIYKKIKKKCKRLGKPKWYAIGLLGKGYTFKEIREKIKKREGVIGRDDTRRPSEISGIDGGITFDTKRGILGF